MNRRSRDSHPASGHRDDGTTTDTIALEIIRGKLLAIADEMGVVLKRSSMSPVIYEVLDFACGVCDAEGQLISQTNGITVFTGTFAIQVNFILEKFAGRIQPGDIYLLNNPYAGGTHYNDVGVIKPIFRDDKLIAFSISISHWTDVGGKSPGSLTADSTEIYQEGICFPGIYLYKAGVQQDDILEMIAANVRIPKMALGDLNAELAAVRIAEKRIHELCEKYGTDVLKQTFHHVLETSERVSREAVAALPDGVYEATDWIDGDGITEERFLTKVRVCIAGDHMTFDYSGSCAQVQGPVNCSRGALISAAKTIFKAIVDPQAPSNEGWFRPLDVIAPDGIVFAATKPAPTGWYYEGTGQASELAWKALAPIVPHRVSAGSSNSLCVTVLGGIDGEKQEPWVLIEPGMVGWGATDERDGNCVTSAITNGDTFNYSVELLEAKFPLRVHQYALNIKGGVGAGRYRGGYGSVREYEILSDTAVLSASFGRSIEKPWPLNNGKKGSCNFFELDLENQRSRAARAPTTIMKRGDRICMYTGGGGGYGDPLERPPDEVLEEVRSEYITAEQARDEYGVAITADGSHVNETATAKLRQEGKH
ncbi:MAG: hydantoinase B/oxoprolinase family protein [Proteobacteria bacterium]|nr:hydantoinase B/oxoprolinase family protein [Pseudomonadota bacterium]